MLGDLKANPIVGALQGKISIKRLNLMDFRCYGFTRLETDGRPVVLTGPNGAGKTNLLEAISYLVPGRGLRGARLDDVGRTSVRSNGSAIGALDSTRRNWAVAAHVNHNGETIEIGTGLTAGVEESARARRVIKIDGKYGKSQSELGKYMSALWLTPQMDHLFLEGAVSRRRFVDRLIFGIDPAHAGLVSAYEKSMRSRNKLLKEGAHDQKWLASLEDSISRYGIAVAAQRKEAIMQLSQIALGEAGPFPGAQIAMAGPVETWLERFPALDVEDKLRCALANSRSADIETGGARVGLHKSDLIVQHAPSGVEAGRCSTGEQKALLVRIILAATNLQAREIGRAPLLLLDEIGAHLDAVRRKALFDIISNMGVQAWMTGTDEIVFKSLGNRAQHFKVVDAKVERTISN